MNTSPRALLLSSLLLATALCIGAQAEPKTYTLFEGENISVGQAGSLHPVRDIDGGSWVIVVDGKEQLVSAKDGPVAMKVVPSQKLTDVTADLANVKSERSYTFANDPAVKMTKNLNDGALVNIGEHTVANQATAASNAAIAAQSVDKSSNGAQSAAASAANTPMSTDSTNMSTSGGDLTIIGSQDDPGDFDQLSVSFDVTAKRKLDEPFFVVITKFHDKNAPDGSSQNLIYAKELNPIDSTVQHVKFEQAGFPFGYHLINFEIHVYNHGIEVATNVAPKRSMLSADQAFEYVKSKYVEAHKGATLPAAPIMGTLPDDLATHLADGKYGSPFFVRVTKEGNANGAFTDATCSTKINDAYLDSVISGIRFKPALAEGNPVDGVATLNLSHLRI
jgi:hypothetical protein